MKNSNQKRDPALSSTIIVSLMCAAILAAYVFLQLQNRPQEVIPSCQFEIFNTEAGLKVQTDLEMAEKFFELSQEQLQQLHDMANVYDPDSEASRMNRTAAVSPFICSEPLWQLIMASQKAWQLTEGRFDVTTGPLTKLWKQAAKEGRLPEEGQLQTVLERVGFSKVQLNATNRSVYFPVAGMQMDFGGILKGYALDQLVQLATDLNTQFPDLKPINRGILNLGGNIYAFATPYVGRESYVIGIRDPDRPITHQEVALELLDHYVATSGSYERFFVVEGKRFSHIINPLDGQPVENTASVTVVTKGGLESDIFSTAIFVGGLEYGRKLATANDFSFQFIRVNTNEEKAVPEVTYFGKSWSHRGNNE